MWLCRGIPATAKWLTDRSLAYPRTQIDALEPAPVGNEGAHGRDGVAGWGFGLDDLALITVAGLIAPMACSAAPEVDVGVVVSWSTHGT
ncbi:MAG TPA: hypothetical protein VIW47_06705 [Nitrospiraceae bacterium]|jgi:hypothetical protein